MACPGILGVGGETKSDTERGICRGEPGKSRKVEKSALIARATMTFHNKSAVALRTMVISGFSAKASSRP